MGDRLQQTIDGVATNYTLDLSTGLTQVLEDGNNTYLYGLERVAQIHGGGYDYFLGDALGSVRQLADASGAVTLTHAYEPYGSPAAVAGTGTSVYGFTGEQQDATGLVYLRARYYAPNAGRFSSRDLWGGDALRPVSLNRWNYAFGDPIRWRDPSGRFPEFCQGMPSKALYELCVLTYYGVQPVSYSQLGQTVDGDRGCYVGPSAFLAGGYLEGVGYWATLHRFGFETVYDFSTMERVSFSYYGGGVNEALDLGAGAIAYVGMVTGLRSDARLAAKYRGFSSAGQAGISGDVGVGVGGGLGTFQSWDDLALPRHNVLRGGKRFCRRHRRN